MTAGHGPIRRCRPDERDTILWTVNTAAAGL